MSIFIDENTSVVVQGITGRDGSFHARKMMEYGTKVVAGVTPGKGGMKFDDTVPVFDTVKEAVEETGANGSVIYVPSAFASDAICEAADAGIGIIVCISEGVPVQEVSKALLLVREKGARLIGPNCPGLISPGKSKLGIIPAQITKPGPIGIVSRSGTLTYEIMYQLTLADIGVSTCIGIGGDPLIGTNFIDCLEGFQNDPDTEGAVLIGEIGGTDEQDAAGYIEKNVTKPVVAFVAGITAPPGRRMGHAGAIISGSEGTAKEKIEAFEKVGVDVARRPADVVELLRKKWSPSSK